MNEPGFRFCGSCGARQNDAGVVTRAPESAPEYERRPGRASGNAQTASELSDAESVAMPRRGRRPLLVLLAVDVALAVAGVLLLQSGLARPRAAAVGAPARSEAVSIQPASQALVATTMVTGADLAVDAPAPAPGEAIAEVPSAPAAVETVNTDRGAAGRAEAVRAGNLGAGSDRPRGKRDDAAPERKPAPEPRTLGDRKPGGIAQPVDPYQPQSPAPTGSEVGRLVDREMVRSQPRFDQCYALTMGGAPPPEEPLLTIAFQVLSEGSVGNAAVVVNNAGSEALGNCVLAILSGWSLRVAPIKPQSVSRRIKFRQAR
jgi:hypothetical protein